MNYDKCVRLLVMVDDLGRFGSMSLVWSRNDHVLDYFFHRGKLWSVGHSALVPEELGTLWGAAGSLWEL